MVKRDYGLVREINGLGKARYDWVKQSMDWLHRYLDS